MPAELAAVDEDAAAAVPSGPPLIESDADEETAPFQLAYKRRGERVVETFEARLQPPFAIFRRLSDLERASASALPGQINDAVRRLLLVALTEESSARLLLLIEGDEEEVGVVTSKAIGGVVDFLRNLHFKSPTRPGSSSGGSRAGRGSQAARSGSTSTSSRSRQKKD